MFRQFQTEYGQLPDILISNAGYRKRVPNVLDISIGELDYMVNANLRTSFILVKGVVGHMMSQQRGRIVFVSSIAVYGGALMDVVSLAFLS